MNKIIKFRAWLEGSMQYRTLKQVSDEGFGLPIEGFGTIIMQFIGLLDKHGKEIYEGDIVKYFAFNKENIGVIEYKDTSFQIAGFNHFSKIYAEEHIEVIGNVYQNSELLK